MNKIKKILIIGPILPPLGGISVHIERLYELLKNDFIIDFIDESKNVKYGIYNLRNNSLIKYFMKILSSDIVFIHSGNKLFKILHIILSKILLKKVIITIHGYGYYRNYIFNTINSFVYNFSNKIIIVNSGILDKIFIKKNKLVIKNAFLPPDIDNEPDLPSEIQEIVKNARSKNNLIISANASTLVHFNNIDLYGLDMCIELTNNLRIKNYSILFIFFLSNLTNENNIYKDAIQKINKYNLHYHFLLIVGNYSFVKLILNSDIIVRPTNIDGDSLTIREAILFNRIIIASDAVTRPENVILFSNRNQDDFNCKVEKECKKIQSCKVYHEINDIYSNVKNQRQSFRNMYKKLLNEL